jgi:CRISPR-associated protein Cas5t
MTRVGDVEIVTLERADQAYFEHTLLPAEFAPRFQRTIAATMARFIDRRRVPTWDKYAILKDRAYYPDPEDLFRTSAPSVWIDPTSPADQGLYRGVMLHRFV